MLLKGYSVFTGMGDEKNLFGKIVGFVTSGIFSVYQNYLFKFIANLLQISFPTLDLVIIPLAGNVLLTI